MITPEQFVELALSFPGTVAAPHFKRTAFKVINKRIFATLDEETKTANLKFSTADQAIYCAVNTGINPVNNKWGQQGWTTFNLNEIDSQLVLDALDTAYKEIFSKF